MLADVVHGRRRSRQHAGPGPLSVDELWRSYLARFDIEHALRLLKGVLGLAAVKVRTPEQVDRWARILTAAHAQLLLARSPAGDLRRPWEKHPAPPGRCPRAGSAATWAHPPVSRNPPAPAPADPREAAKDQLPATFSPGMPTCHAQKNLP